MKEKLVLFKIIGSIIFYFTIFNGIAQQDTIHVDELNKYIAKNTFYSKIKSPIYRGIRYSTDTLVLEKIKPNYYFGELPIHVKSQLFKLLYSRHNLDTTKTLIIHYLDTLKSKKEYPKRSLTIFFDSIGNEIKIPKRINSASAIGTSFGINPNPYEKVAKHIHKESYNSFLRGHKKCIQRYKAISENIKVLHFYSYNNGHPDEVKKIKWYKDYGLLIKKVFSDKYNEFKTVIILPNGEFYIQYGRNKYNFDDMLAKDKWGEFKNEFLVEMKSFE